MAKSKSKSKIMGRPIILIDPEEFKFYYHKWLGHSRLNKFDLDDFAKKLQISRSTLLRRIKNYRKTLE
jgi:transcriptional antiterminator